MTGNVYIIHTLNNKGIINVVKIRYKFIKIKNKNFKNKNKNEAENGEN